MAVATIRSFFLAPFLLLAVLQSAHAASLPGIPDSGLPNFTNSVQVQLFSLGAGDFLLAASNAGAPVSFNNATGSFPSTDDNPAQFLLTAQFRANGTYVPNTGTVRISGSIPYPSNSVSGVYVTGDLLTGKLTGFNYDAGNLGFSMTMISGFGTLFGKTAESVYLSVSDLSTTLGFGGAGLIATSGSITANAITTIPVPAAIWLLGSALLGLLSIGRRN